MYQIEIDGRRCIEYENDYPRYVWGQYLEIIRRNPDKEVALFKDGDLMMVRGLRKIWTGMNINDTTKD
jgi:hypothetical protein